MSLGRIKLRQLLAERAKSLNPSGFPDEVFSLYSIPGFDRGQPDVLRGEEIGSAKQILYPGDVLLSKIVPHIRRSWAVPQEAESRRQIGSGEWIVFRSNLIDPGYLSRVLVGDDFHQAFMRTVAGVGGSLLRARPAAVAEIEIPLPSLDEQKRIAAVLDKAEEIRRQRRESLQLTEELLKSVFFEMFVENPDAADWESRSVEWMTNDAKGSIRTGPFGSQLLHSEFVDQGVAVLGIDNAVKNRFEWGQPRFITPEKYEDLRRYKVFPDDLIITIMGTLGRCAIVPHDIPEAINTKHLCCISLNQKKCLPVFLHAAFLNHPYVHRQLGVRAKGAVMPGLNMGIIKELTLPLPPLELQRKFGQVVAAISTSRSNFEASQELTGDLFSSLQQRAFRGELDLSRLVLDPVAHIPEPTAPVIPDIKQNESKTVASFLQTPAILAAALKPLEDAVSKGELIPWSADYFKYRILAAQPIPFSFADLLQKAETIFEESPPYETIRDLIFDLLGQDGKPAVLRQRFDLRTNLETNEVTGRNEIVFEPAP